MRKLILTLTLFSFCVYDIQAQMLQENDTLRLNYLIAHSEFGGRDEGLIIYYGNNNEIKAKSVRYNCRSFGKSLNADTIIDFYEKNKNNYTIIKAEWNLSEKQRDYITKILDEIKTRPVEENVFSNAYEYYAILTKKESYVYIDRAGDWKKYLEIKKDLDIKTYPRKL